MRKRGCEVWVFGLVAIVVLGMVLAKPPMTAAQEEVCRIVNLRGSLFSTGAAPPPPTRPDLAIDPPNLRVPVGACVVWVNWIRGGEVKISFKEGKRCQDVTQSPMGFKLERQTGCFLTDFLRMGQTSSLRFMQEGTYEYDLEVPDKAVPLKGSIVVYQKQKK